MKKIIHIDMDCFYAAIEMRDDPTLQDQPIAVGGAADRRGVICTSNYIARRSGVRSAMATAQALHLCPKLILLPVNMAKYKAAALKIREIFHAYTDKIEPLSLDEAYLDVSDCSHFQGSATQIAAAIRKQIYQEQQLTASAGIAPNKFLAKVASDWQKPNGQYVITPSEVSHFIAQLPINKLPGVGNVTAKKINNLNVYTCLDLQAFSREQLALHFGSFGQKLFNYCRGDDHREVESQRVRKSVSVEQTFAKDMAGLPGCMNALPVLYQQLEQRLNPYKTMNIKNQFIKIKFNNFTQTTAEYKVSTISLNLFKHLCQTAYQRFNLPIRLLGLGVHFQENYPLPLNEKQLFLDI